MIQKNNHLLLFLCGLIALSGLVYSLVLGDELRFLPDERDYHVLAQSIARDGVYSLDGTNPTAFRPPGYPAYLAVFYKLNAPTAMMRWSNFLLAALSLCLVWNLLIDFSGRFAASLGILFVSGYAVLGFNAGTFYPQTLAAALLLIGTALWSRSNLTIWSGLLGGFSFAALILTAPVYAFAPIVIAIWRLIFFPKTGRVALLIGWLGLFVLCGGWILRNYNVFGEILLTTNSGINLFVGNSALTQPGAGRTVDIGPYELQAASMTELEADRYFRSLAIDFIRAQPLRAVDLYLRKLLSYFNFYNQYVTDVRWMWVVNLVMLITYVPLLVVFIARYVWVSKIPFTAHEILLHSLYLSSAFVIAIYFSRIRFRLPMDYVLIMGVAIFLARLNGEVNQSQGLPQAKLT